MLMVIHGNTFSKQNISFNVHTSFLKEIPKLVSWPFSWTTNFWTNLKKSWDWFMLITWVRYYYFWCGYCNRTIYCNFTFFVELTISFLMENKEQLAFVFALLKIDTCFLQTQNIARQSCLQESFNFSETTKCLLEQASALLVDIVCERSICRDITLKFTDATEGKSCLKNPNLTDILITIIQRFRTSWSCLANYSY